MFKHRVEMSSRVLFLRLLWNFSVLEAFLQPGTRVGNDCVATLGSRIESNEISFLVHPWATFEYKTMVSVVCFLGKC